MTQFITFNDGLLYINTDEIRSFEHEMINGIDGKPEAWTVFNMKDGQKFRHPQSIGKIAGLFQLLNARGEDS